MTRSPTPALSPVTSTYTAPPSHSDACLLTIIIATSARRTLADSLDSDDDFDFDTTDHPTIMSSNSDSSYPEFFRRRTLGRAPSPPTWACYEQIPYDDDYSDSESENNSCSEDEEDYDNVASDGERPGAVNDSRSPSQLDGDMELDEGDDAMSSDKVAEMKKDVKGKQRATESHYESPRRERRKKQDRKSVV